MNGVFLAILAVIIVATLSFLMPWVSKKIEEPFTAGGGGGGSGTCLTAESTTPVIIPSAANTRADHVELGKQKYNFLGLLQSNPTRRAFDTGLAPSAVGSIDNTVGPDGTTMLNKLNKTLQSALETVFLDPQTKDLSGAVMPNISFGPSYAPILNNGGAYFEDALKPERAERRPRVGYVEERLPPRDQGLLDAAKCEVNNMFYQRTEGADGIEATLLDQRNRGQMCKLLEPSATINPIKDAFGSDVTKICGVCIKGAKPISEPSVYNPGGKAYNGIGGMFISEGDKNVDAEKANRAGITNPINATYKPSYGACEEGYFFIPGQHTQCMKAAQRLNCDEIQATGGFDGGVANDGTAIGNSDCRACIDSQKVNYAYYKDVGGSGIRLRIAVPTGTGRTLMKITHKDKTGGTRFSNAAPYVFTSTKSTDFTIKSVGESALKNIGILTLGNAKPGDTIQVQVVQEYPHRPREIPKEVFFVQFTTDGGKTLADAQKLADSLDCDLATKAQLDEAQSKNMQVCEAGWASDGIYTVRGPSVQFAATGERVCSSNTNKGGVTSIIALSPTSATQDASGAWLYGVKPSAGFVKLEQIGADDSTEVDPKISNFYTYYTQTTSSDASVSPDVKTSKYFLESNNASIALPNYRGICIQMEQNTTPSSISVGIENYITKVGTATIDSNIINRLQKYSRNGPFNGSERIKLPTTDLTTGPYATMNQNQYWLWSPHEGDTQSAVFDFTFVVPGFFEIPTHTEDQSKCLNSVLFDTKAHLDMAVPSVCDTSTDPSDECIASLFQKAGGDLMNGELSPLKSGITNDDNLKYFRFAKPTQKRSAAQIQDVLNNIKKRMRGEGLANFTDAERIAEMNKASKQLIGRDAVGPCQELMETDLGIKIVAKKLGANGYDAKCLDFLYRNTTGDSNNTVTALRDGTYRDIGAFFSGLKWPSEYNGTDESTYPYRACQPAGSWAPIKNGIDNTQAIKAINDEIGALNVTGLSDIEKAIKVFNDLHETANSNTISDAAKQELAIERCYGIKKKTFVTNCNGILGTMLKIMDFNGTDASGSIVSLTLKDAEGKTIPSINTVRFGSEVAVQKVQLTFNTKIIKPYIVLLKDARNVVAQKVIPAARDLSNATVEFLQEDVRPYISYNDIRQSAGTTTILRFESTVGRGYFLDINGNVTAVTDTTTTTQFELSTPQSNYTSSTDPIYSLKIGNKFIARDISTSVALSPSTTQSPIINVTTRNANSDWAIKPAVNGAYAFVSLELANVAGYYLVAEPQADGTFKAKARVINSMSDVDKFLACWRLYPAGS